MSPVLTLAEAAERLRMNESTLRYWVQSGKLQASKIGRCWKIQESALQDLIDDTRHRPVCKVEPGQPIRIPLLTERVLRRAKRRHVG